MESCLNLSQEQPCPIILDGMTERDWPKVTQSMNEQNWNSIFI